MNNRYFFNALLVFVFLFFTAGNLFAEKLTVCYTNSLNGFIDYCHCKDDPKGGLVKRATVIKNLRKRHSNLLLIESGDFFHFEKDLLLAEYIIKAYKYINYDAVLFGDQEFSLGVDEFMSYRKRLPFLCNNLLVKKRGGNYPAFKRYSIIRKGNLQIGIIGSMNKNAFSYYPKEITSRVSVMPQVAEIKKDIASLKKAGINLIVLISHSGYEKDKKMALVLKDVDLIVGGHSQTLLRKPVRIGNTLIVQAGTNGSRIGILKATVKNGSIVSFRNSFKRPDDKQPADDPVIRRMIDEYNAKLRKNYKGLKFKKMINIRRLLKDTAMIIVVSCMVAVFINLFHPGGFLLIGKKEYARKQIVAVSAREAKIKYDADIAVFIDTRNSKDFRNSSIAGAINIPAFPESVRLRLLEKNFPLLSSEKEIVLFCTGAGCGDSTAIADALIEMGYSKNIYFIKTGFPGWKKEGYAVQGEESKE